MKQMNGLGKLVKQLWLMSLVEVGKAGDDLVGKGEYKNECVVCNV